MRVPAAGVGRRVGRAQIKRLVSSERLQVVHVYIWRCCGRCVFDGEKSSSLFRGCGVRIFVCIPCAHFDTTTMGAVRTLTYGKNCFCRRV